MEALNTIPIRKDMSRLRACMGLSSYYHRFVCGFSFLVKPLILLTRDDQECVWGLTLQV